MTRVPALICALLVLTTFAQADEKVPAALNFTMKSLAGKDIDLAKYKGKVLLIANTASECGLTPQYEQLQAVHEKYGKKGVAVLGFPCNQFGSQEPGSAAEITTFCKENYGVTFDMFAKIEVNGDGACPLYKHLTTQIVKPKGPGKVSWNFEKFVIGRDGKVVARFEPRTKPDADEVVAVLEAELGK